MRDWLRRWLGIEERGTLVFEANGSVIVGCPGDLTQAAADAVRLRMEEWLASPGSLLVLPFPVSVVDRR